MMVDRWVTVARYQKDRHGEGASFAPVAIPTVDGSCQTPKHQGEPLRNLWDCHSAAVARREPRGPTGASQ
jgi:hypothetical protein